MPQENLDVFLSSDQEEFEKERNRLSSIISNIPFLTCTPLENAGAAARDVLEASLRAVRNSHVYVGVFGRRYSEITVKEYREAVRYRKPCLTYVKKVKQRDTLLQKFIDGELKNQFKYSPFRGKEDLYEQVAKNLRKFIFETLEDGLDARRNKKEETQRLIREEQHAASTRPVTGDPLEEAYSALEQGSYLECLVKTTIALEMALKVELRKKNVNVEKKPLGFLLRSATESKIVDLNEARVLQEIQYIRNSAVHLGDIPSKQTITWVLENAKDILNSLKMREGVDSRFIHLHIHYSQRTDTPNTTNPARPRYVLNDRTRQAYWIPTWLESCIRQHKIPWNTHDGEKALKSYFRKNKIEYHDDNPLPEDLGLDSAILSREQ